MARRIAIIFLIICMLTLYSNSVMAATVQIENKKTISTSSGLPEGARAWSIVRYDHYLYVAAGPAGLQIFDVSDPLNPVNVTPTAEVNPYLQGTTYQNHAGIIYQESTYLYVSFAAPVQVTRKYSLANPANPQLVATFSAVSGNAATMKVANGYLFTGNNGNRALAFDNDTSGVTDPTNPIPEPSGYRRFLDFGMFNMEVSGNVLYATKNNTIYAVDITDPTKVSADSSMNGAHSVAKLSITNANLTELLIKDGYLYCNDEGNKKIYRIDISDPTNIGNLENYVEVFSSNNPALNFDVYGGLLYVLSNSTLMVFDLSKPGFPKIAEKSTSAGCIKIIAEDNYIYIDNNTSVDIFPVTIFNVNITSAETIVQTLPFRLIGNVIGGADLRISINNGEMANSYIEDITTVSEGIWEYEINDIYNGEYTIKVELLENGIVQADAEATITVDVTKETPAPARKNIIQNQTDVSGVSAVVSVDHENKKVSCIGAIPMRTRIGFKEVSIAVKNPEGSEIFTQSQRSLGNYDFSFDLPTPLFEDQDYVVIIKCEGEDEVSQTFRYYGEGYIAAALQEVNNATPDTLVNVLNTYNVVFMLDLGPDSKFASLNDKQKVLSKLCEIEYGSTQDLVTAFNNTVNAQYDFERVMREINNAAGVEELKDKITKNTSILDLDLSIDPYQDLAESAKNEIFEEIYEYISENGQITVELLKQYFEEDVCLLKLVNSTHWENMKNVLLKYKTQLQLSSAYINKYDGLTESERILVNKAVSRTGEGDYYTQIGQIAQLFKNKIDEVIDNRKESANNKKGVGGGGGGGGRERSITVVQPVIVEQPNVVAPVFNINDVFSDLSDVQWAHESISYLYQNKTVVGVGDQFLPNDSVTREQFLKMLIIAFDINISNEDCGFNDVDKTAWYYPYVATANKLGLVNGISNEEFGVGLPINREQMAVMLHRFIQYKGMELTETHKLEYTDAISEYAQPSVVAISNAGIMRGVAEGVFSAQGIATRAMAAKVIYETLKVTGQLN